ncbi:MAG: ABC transporter permease subunit [Phycisphaeraceae bacterium]|nr:ABC transporter permease subunit [Phycisphaeraceae bacterium]
MPADRAPSRLAFLLVVAAATGAYAFSDAWWPLADQFPGLEVYAWAHALAVIASIACLVLLWRCRRPIDLLLPSAIVAAVLFLHGLAWFSFADAAFASGLAFPPNAPVTGPLVTPLIPLIAAPLLILITWFRVSGPPKPRRSLRRSLRAGLRSLNPIALLLGPVFQKEARVIGRRRTTYWARAAYPLALTLIVGLTYLAMSSDIRASTGAFRLQQLQQIAPVLGTALAACQFALLVFIAPILTSGGICDERRARTLPALMTTPMTSAQIIGGKLTSRIVELFILALVGLPLLLALRVFGGLEASTIFASTCVALSAAALAAALGLMFSIWHKRAGVAAVFAMLTMVAFALVPVSIFVALELRAIGGTGPPPGWIFALAAPATMFLVVLSTFEPEAAAMMDVHFGGQFAVPAWVLNVALNLILTGAVVAFSTVALRAVLIAEAAGATIDSQPRRARRRRAAPAPSSPDGEPRAEALSTQDDDAVVESHRKRTVSDRPVLWREVRQAAFGSRWPLQVFSVVAVLSLAWLYWRFGLFDETLHGIVGSVIILAICLHAAVSATAAINGEREAQTWDVLLTTTLTGREIILGKLLGSIRRQWFLFAVLVAHFSISVLAGAVHPVTVFQVLLIALCASVFLNGTGLLLSLLFRRSTIAAVLNISLALLLWIGLPVGVSILNELFSYRGGNELDWIMQCFITINPVVMTSVSLQEGVARNPWVFDTYDRYSMPTGSMGLAGFTAWLLGGCLLQAGFGLACVWVSIHFFRRLAGRCS